SACGSWACVAGGRLRRKRRRHGTAAMLLLTLNGSAQRIPGSYVRGGVPKRPTGADCKSAGFCLRRFESYPLHHLCGCSSMVEPQPSKLMVWVRFPSPAPLARRGGRAWCGADMKNDRQGAVDQERSAPDGGSD